MEAVVELASGYECAADMPGVRMLADVRLERLAQGVALGMTYADACVHGGWSGAVHGLLDKPGVLDRIAYHRMLGVEAASITRERVLANIGAIANSDLREALEWGSVDVPLARDALGEITGGGTRNFVRLKDSSSLPPGIASAIAEVKLTKDGVSLKTHDRLAANVHLGKHFGMFVERHELSGPGGAPIKTITNEMDAQQAADAYAALIKGE